MFLTGGGQSAVQAERLGGAAGESVSGAESTDMEEWKG